jgi:hypothetical protein
MGLMSLSPVGYGLWRGSLSHGMTILAESTRTCSNTIDSGFAAVFLIEVLTPERHGVPNQPLGFP